MDEEAWLVIDRLDELILSGTPWLPRMGIDS